MGVSFIPTGVRSGDDIVDAFDRVASAGANGLLNISDTLFYLKRKQMAELAMKHRLPWSTSVVEYADAGALIAYGPDYPAIFRRAGALIDRILKGTSSSPIPVAQTDVYQLVLNGETARALHVEFPKALLLQATRVI